MYVSYAYWWFLPFSILGVGILNAYNFMDGINGITGAYSLAVLMSLSYVNHFVQRFIEQDFLTIIAISVLVFLVFNFRRKTICFGGVSALLHSSRKKQGLAITIK